MAKKGNICSFCGRNEQDVDLLIAGIGAYICNNCIESAHNIITEKFERRSKEFNIDNTDLPKPRQIKEFLDQYVIGQDEAKKFRSEEHTSELQSHDDLVCRLLLEKKKKN